ALQLRWLLNTLRGIRLGQGSERGPIDFSLLARELHFYLLHNGSSQIGEFDDKPNISPLGLGRPLRRYSFHHGLARGEPTDVEVVIRKSDCRTPRLEGD